MMFSLVGILWQSSIINAQYTYWTYSGEGVNPFGAVISIKGFIEDSTFRTIGARAENSQRAYEAVHNIHTGELTSSKSSDYGDLAYAYASGYYPSSFYKLEDNGYFILRTVINADGDA